MDKGNFKFRTFHYDGRYEVPKGTLRVTSGITEFRREETQRYDRFFSLTLETRKHHIVRGSITGYGRDIADYVVCGEIDFLKYKPVIIGSNLPPDTKIGALKLLGKLEAEKKRKNPASSPKETIDEKLKEMGVLEVDEDEGLAKKLE